MEMSLHIAVAMVVVVLILMVQHYLPWTRMLRTRLPMIARYVMGCMAIDVPVSVLLVVWNDWYPLALMWACTVAGGLAVMVTYLVDGYMAAREQAEAEHGENQVLREDINNG